jgi:hypothetical protein
MELSFVRGLYDGSGPWASVYLDASHHTEAARTAVKIRWKDLRTALREQDIDEPTLRALETELIDEHTMRALGSTDVEEDPHPGRHGLAMFATDGAVRYSEITSEPPRVDSATVSSLPHLTPLLSGRGEQIPWLRVIVNRMGADILEPAHDTIQVERSNLFPIRRTHGGGWSEEHLRRKAELGWLHTAQEVAAAVGRLAESVDAELVVIGGDVRARQLLIGQLPERWRARAVEVDGGSRAAGADPAAIEAATRVAVADAVARHRAEAIDRFRVRGGEYAVAGAAAVVAAFDRGQVETLLLDPDRSVPDDDALIHAAASTDAGLLLLSSADVGLADGVGAVLRYADQSTRR